MQALDSSPLVRWWTKRHGIKISYKAGKRRRRYIPDFLVEMVDGSVYLEETKGYVFDRMKFARKNLAAMFYCKFRGYTFRILYESDLDEVSK